MTIEFLCDDDTKIKTMNIIYDSKLNWEVQVMNRMEKINNQYTYIQIPKLNNLKPTLLTTNHTNN